MVPSGSGIFPEYREVTGTPREKLWALWAIRRKHTSPQVAGAPPWAGGRIGIGLGGGGPPFLLSYSCFPSSPTLTREGGNPTPGGSRTPLGRTIERDGPSPPPLLYIWGRGHPIDTQVDHLIF